MTIQDQVRDLIAGGKTKDALYRLSEELRGTEEGNTITLLQSRWANNHRSYSQGILTNSDYQMENNRINHALLSVISELDASPNTSPAKQKAQEVVQQIYNIHIGHIGDVIHGDKFGGDKVMGDKVQGDKVTNNNPEPKHNVTTNAEESVPKKTILFIASDPSNTTNTYSGAESQKIRNAINAGLLRADFDLVVNFASNIEEVLRLLKTHKPAIVHFSMHGAREGMMFEGTFGAAQVISAEILASFFELVNFREKTVECVLLSACDSTAHGEAINQYVDYVVGMNGAIPAKAAIEYTSAFYTALLTGDDYALAHKTALVQLRLFASSIDYEGDVPIIEMPKLFIPRALP